MNLRITTSICIVLAIVTWTCNCSQMKDSVEIVTYGEPCAIIRQLPIKIEGPKPPRQEEKIPVSLNFRIISDLFAQPRRLDYPIEIETSCTASSPPKDDSHRITVTDILRGRTYTYNTYVPPASSDRAAKKNYNYAIEIPVSTKQSTEECEEKRVQRLRGLTSRIDRILVPACRVSSSSQYQC